VSNTSVTHSVNKAEEVELIEHDSLSVQLGNGVDGKQDPAQDDSSSVWLEITLSDVIKHQPHDSLKEVGTEAKSDQFGVINDGSAVGSEDISKPDSTGNGQEGDMSNESAQLVALLEMLSVARLLQIGIESLR